MADKTRYTANLVSDSNVYSDITNDRVGIGTTVPTSKLHVLGDVLVSGVVTASSFSGNATSATYATTAGVSTNLKGGAGGSIPYQSAADTTVFLANGTAGYVLQANGGTSAPTWVPAVSAGSISGITIRDEGTIIGTAGSVTTINFVGNIVSAAATAGIATITFLDYVSNAGFSTNSGISTNLKGGTGGSIPYQSAADTTVFLANGSSGQILQSNGGTSAPSWVSAAPAGAITGITIRDEGTIVGTANSVSTLNFVGSNITATASGSISTITVNDNLVGTALSISGISTFSSNVLIPSSNVGIGTTNPLQQLQVGTANTLGINTTGTVFVVTSNADVGIGTTRPTSKLDVRGDVNVSGVVTATTFSGQVNAGVSTLGIATATNLTAQQLNVSGVGTFQSSNLKVVGASTSFQYSIVGSTIAANRNLTLPLLTTDDTVAVLGLSQTFSGSNTFSGATNTFSGVVNFTGNNITFNPSNTATTFTLGSTAGTGNIIVGQSTASQTTNIQAGASGIGTTKTINLGTGGLTSSFTQINIGPGPSAGVGTVVINSGTNLGIGSLTPTSALDIIGNAKVSGVITATTFSGNASSATYATSAGVSTSVIGGIASVTQLTVSGVSTFSSNVLIPSSSVGIGTTNPLQQLQVGTANTLGINTTGTVFVVTSNADVGIGTTRPTSKLHVLGDVNVSGVSTLGVTSTTNLTSQQLNVSGVSTFNNLIKIGNSVSIGATRDSGNNDFIYFNPLNESKVSIGINTTLNWSAISNIPDIAFVGDKTIGGTPKIAIADPTTTDPLYQLYAAYTNGSINGYVRQSLTGSYAIALTGNNVFSVGDRSSLSGSRVSNFGSGQEAFVVTLGGSTSLFYSKSKKLETSGIGVTVTGTIQSDNLNVGTGGTVITTTSTGLVGIGTTNPTSTLTVSGTTSTNQLNVSGVSTFTNGPVLIGTATSTGTASQRLQVTGGTYVSGNVGVAVTSPSFAVDVSGDTRVQSTGKMRFGGTAGTTNFYIQYNSTANSLDFVAG